MVQTLSADADCSSRAYILPLSPMWSRVGSEQTRGLPAGLLA